MNVSFLRLALSLMMLSMFSMSISSVISSSEISSTSLKLNSAESSDNEKVKADQEEDSEAQIFEKQLSLSKDEEVSAMFDINKFIRDPESHNNSLHMACLNDNYEMALVLLNSFRPDEDGKMKKSKFINAVNEYGYTLLHFAACNLTKKSKKLLNLLVGHGADPNSRINVSGMTPLHFVCLGLNGINQQIIFQNSLILISAGADINALDSEGNIAFDYLFDWLLIQGI